MRENSANGNTLPLSSPAEDLVNEVLNYIL